MIELGYFMENQASILIIDDDHDLSSVLQTIFLNKGYRTSVAHSAAQVASLLGLNNERMVWPVSVILLDLMMPQVDGGELYGWLRAHPKTADTPIIVLSAVDSIAKRVELLNRGADDYIVKPCPVEELLARVSIHIQLHELRQARHIAQSRFDLQVNFINAIDLIGQYISHPEDELAVMLQKIARAVVQHFEGVSCVIYLQHKTSDQMTIIGCYPEEFTPPTSYLPFIKRITLQQESITSGLAVGMPIIKGGKLTGVMVVQVKDLTKMQNAMLQSLSVISRQISMAVANAQLREQIQKQQAQPAFEINGNPETYQTISDLHDPLQTVYSYLQLLTEFEMERDKQIDYLKLASNEIVNLLNNS